MSAAESLETFLSRLNRSEQMSDLCDASHAGSAPRGLSNRLVKQRWLTRGEATQFRRRIGFTSTSKESGERLQASETRSPEARY